MRKKSNKSVLTIVLIVVVAFGLLGLGNVASFFGRSDNHSQSTRDIALSCTLDMYTQFHIHPHLTILANGTAQTISANTGVNLGCMHPLHTHDTSGTIHVESPEQRDFTLSDFFAVWEKQFNRDQILDYKRDAGHEIVMTVDGTPSGDFENLVLKDKQEIVIEYRNVLK